MQYFKYYQILSIVCTIIFPVWPSGIEKNNNNFCQIIPGIDGSLHLIDTNMTIKYHQWEI